MNGKHGDADIYGITHQQGDAPAAQSQRFQFMSEAGHATQIFPVIETLHTERQGLLLRAPGSRIHKRVDDTGKYFW